MLQSYALAASYLEGQGAFKTETEETLLWCSIATSLILRRDRHATFPKNILLNFPLKRFVLYGPKQRNTHL